MIQEELKKWAEEVVQTYNPIRRSYYTQSDLTKIKESPEILILGINPGSTGIAKEPITADVFLKGNKSFSEREKSWHLWKNLRKILSAGGVDYLLDDESRFVFSNVYHCDTLKANELSPDLKDEQLVKLTIELIKKLHPVRVLCLGKNGCWQALEKASGMKTNELIKGELNYAKLDGIPIYGIKHTSSFYTNEESAMIGKVLAALFNGQVEHDAEKIAIQFKDEIEAFEKRRDQLKPESIWKWMIEKAFEQYCHLTQHKEMDNNIWYEITPDIVAGVSAKNKGNVIIRHSNFDPKDNYSKHLNDNKYKHRDELKECLKKYGYDLTKEDIKTSLGHKPFKKYKDYEDKDKGPQYVVLSILEEFAELKDKFETIFGGT